VLDLGLPDMPGHQVADEIRAQPWGEDTLLIAVTGWGQVQDRAQTTASGFAHHLVKPVEPTQLLDLLQRQALHEGADDLARA
jgi:CheY-like chemotaxis protein